ncbi:hypothetical protein LSCM1_07123 [Leishmania martiniquensis]|uniref:Uncharacterized protein n=1 Tax=Leishmania martiniquensis TaxID=1580590 RepID=A0A836HP98_9TRYP|nr:hypothetical protein LSCM1_07123 [Leishmania martiniquensis]
MRGSTRANAFSDADTQAAVLEEWKKRSAKSRKAARSLRQKVQQLKSDAEAGRRATQWLQECDALHCEQEACEAALEAMEMSLGGALLDAESERRRLELSALKELLSQQLEAVGTLRRTSAAKQPQTSSSGVAATDQISQIRHWIAAELEKCGESLTECAAPSASLQPQENAVAECRSAARQAQLKFDVLCDSYHPSHQLRDTFEAALRSATEEALTRIMDASVLMVATTPPDILRTVRLILKMGRYARKFDISAATLNTLIERVLAVRPDMSFSGARMAIEEAIELRKARVLSQAAITDFQRTNASLLSSCESAFMVAQQLAKQRQEKAEAARERVAAQNRRHAHLTEERAVYEAVLRQRQSVAERMQAAAAAKERALQEKRAIEFQERLRLFEAFEAQRLAWRQKERGLAELQAQALEEEKAARMRRNEERVEYRRHQKEQWQIEQKKRERELSALLAKKQEALQRFFASVDKQIGVEADPQRLLKATSSSAQTEKYTTLAQATRPPITGFSDEQIMKDPRVRLYHALLTAGLHTTPYGREVITRGYHVSTAQQSSEGNPLRGEFS